jgi:hypothetical protein
MFNVKFPDKTANCPFKLLGKSHEWPAMKRLPRNAWGNGAISTEKNIISISIIEAQVTTVDIFSALI